MQVSRRSISRRGSAGRGAAAVELAIVVGPLVLLFMIALDFCRLFYHYTTVTN